MGGSVEQEIQTTQGGAVCEHIWMYKYGEKKENKMTVKSNVPLPAFEIIPVYTVPYTGNTN